MDRTQMESLVIGFYDVRLQNKPQAILNLLAPSAQMRVAGATNASPIAHQTTTPEELRASVESLVGNWQWTNIEMLSLLIDGNSAAARYTLQTTHVPTGQKVTAEMMDQFYFDDAGNITELIEFVDTAMVAQLDK
ncbi:MAG: nuclear transport factor 2 family protein [Pseudomonadota bacterium]